MASTPLRGTPSRVVVANDDEELETEVAVLASPNPGRVPFSDANNASMALLASTDKAKPPSPKNPLLKLLNSGTAEELTILPGVGPKRAKVRNLASNGAII